MFSFERSNILILSVYQGIYFWKLNYVYMMVIEVQAAHLKYRSTSRGLGQCKMQHYMVFLICHHFMYWPTTESSIHVTNKTKYQTFSRMYIIRNMDISRFHAHTCKVVRTKCQAVPSIPPWQWATAKRDLMHCMFLAVSWKKKDMQNETRIIIILFFCIYLLFIRSVFFSI